MTKVFADSFFYLAIVNANDVAHARAVAYAESFVGEVATTG